MNNDKANIGLALSGGGIRATIFHLGVLKWMAENNMLEQITYISSVSGASLCIGLIYSCNHLEWPDSQQFLNHVLPDVEKKILKNDIQTSLIYKVIKLLPSRFTKKVNMLAKVIKHKWDIDGTMADLKGVPIWCANCTTYETGKRFRITRDKIGDYTTGFAKNHNLSIADAMAASAGFPFLIGPYRLKRNKYDWGSSEYENRNVHISHGKYYHLWDGGVYDNLGLEPLYKISDENFGGKLNRDVEKELDKDKEVEYIIVSNAGTPKGYKKRIITSNPKRLLDIAMEQVNSLRTRNIINHIKFKKEGLFFNIGNTAKYILEFSNCAQSEKDKIIEKCMPVHDAEYVRKYKTTLSSPSEYDFKMILRHGYEVAECTHFVYK